MTTPNLPLFRATYDSLSEREQLTLMDIAEDNVYIYVLRPRVVWKLEQLGLVRVEVFQAFLTDYGAEFVAWLSQPHESPEQLNLF